MACKIPPLKSPRLRLAAAVGGQTNLDFERTEREHADLFGAVRRVVGTYRQAGPAALAAVPPLIRMGFHDQQIVQLITAVSLFYTGFRNAEVLAREIYSALPETAEGLIKARRTTEQVYDLITTVMRKAWNCDGFKMTDLVPMARRMSNEAIIDFFSRPGNVDLQ
ncbi:hypothetical protein HZC35_07585 [Candidatus Saganbacteria bacterium]|nr:hypothetical protein [Candidatus Saganbacteria bacterium]